LKHGLQLASVQFSPDGQRIVTASRDKTARVWDAKTGHPVTEPLKHEQAVGSAQFSPDGKRVVTASYDFTARVWDAQTGRPVTSPLEHDSPVICAQFSPDGKRVVTASSDFTARVWDAQTGQPVTAPLKHRNQVNSAQFSPDGKRVVTASSDGTARVWDARTGLPLSEPLKHGSSVNSAEFSPDGKRVVTTSSDGTARVWDAQTGQQMSEPLKHGSTVTSVQFSPDGKRIVTTSQDGIARAWDVGFAPSKCPAWLLPLAEALSGTRLNKEGVLEPTSLNCADTLAQLWQSLNNLPDHGDGVMWGRWLLADRSTRTIMPFSCVSISEGIENRSKGNPAWASTKDALGAMPLHWAALKGQKEEVELLLANKADVNARNNAGETPLLWASYMGHKGMVELLLANKAEINARDGSGATPLHAAAQFGYNYLAELLLASNADINAKNNVGETPLHFAAAFGHQDVVELLRKHGGHDEPGVSQVASTPSEQHSLQHDLDGIQGTWKIIALKSNGQQSPAEIVAVLKLVFKDDTLTFTPGEPGFTDYKYKLDPTAKPPSFAMTALAGKAKGVPTKGIYLLEGDRLKICIGSGVRNPTEFTAEAGSGQGMYSLEREK